LTDRNALPTQLAEFLTVLIHHLREVSDGESGTKIEEVGEETEVFPGRGR